MTLISTHGFPGSYVGEHMSFLSTSHSYSERDHAQLSLRSWVNVVTGKMTGIDRAANHVLLSGGRKVPYDHLLLCTGQQYQVPCPSGVDINRPTASGELSVQPGRRYTGKVPSNLFTLNDHRDCVEVYRWLQEKLPDLNGDVVVYGDGLDAYTCVEALLSMRIPGSGIHLVRPPSEGSCFDGPAVGKAVGTALEKSQVHVHHGCLLAQMNEGRDPEPLTSVSFAHAAGDPLLLRCSVFLNLSSKGVDYSAFKAINDACLVYDGHLVIDSTFHTNDCSIRAAGPLTKFARRYHADQWSHSHFSSREVGQELAGALLPLFDPTLEPATNPPGDLDRLTPMYQQAKVQGGKLPGRYNYLHVTKPPLQLPATGPSSGQQGREILTGRTETGNYFLLRLNRYDVVETLTCLSQKPIPVSNLLCLYGKHQLLLNRLCSRYDEGLVHDLYRENWCLAIYHDRFTDFEQEMRQIMESTQVKDNNSAAESIPHFIQRLMNKTLDDSEDPMLILKKVFAESGGLATLKTSTLNFLRYNTNHLTMYAQPGCL